jgi:fluoroquinolone resistance protein
MPATPDVIEEDLTPWTGALESQFDIEDSLVTGSFEDVRAAGGRSLSLVDVVAGGCELSGADLTGARLRRVLFDGGRLAGTQFIDAELDDVVFRNCKLTLATFHSSRLREVVFSGCELDEAFLGRGTMQSVRFEDCRLLRADFSGAMLKRVDLRGSELDPAGDVGGLRGAIIDSAQLAGLAGQLAHAAGIRVDED